MQHVGTKMWIYCTDVKQGYSLLQKAYLLKYWQKEAVISDRKQITEEFYIEIKENQMGYAYITEVAKK